jgi:hypothetical protein
LIAAGKRPGIAISLDFSIVEIAESFAAFEGIPGQHAYNPIGSIMAAMPPRHLIRLAAAPCIRNFRLGIATLELKVAYHKAKTGGTGKVR